MENVNKSIRCSEVEQEPWKKVTGAMVNAYRATPHSSTGVAPGIYMFGKDDFGKIPSFRKTPDDNEMEELARRNDAKAKEKMRKYADWYQRVVTMEFKKKDPVMLKWERSRKYAPLFDPHPYRIVAVMGNMITAVRDNHRITRNRFFKLISEQSFENAMELVKKRANKPTNRQIALTLNGRDRGKRRSL